MKVTDLRMLKLSGEVDVDVFENSILAKTSTPPLRVIWSAETNKLRIFTDSSSVSGNGCVMGNNASSVSFVQGSSTFVFRNNGGTVVHSMCPASPHDSSQQEKKTIQLCASRTPHTLSSISMDGTTNLRVHNFAVFHKKWVTFVISGNTNVSFQRALHRISMTKALCLNFSGIARFNVEDNGPLLYVDHLSLNISGMAKVQNIRVSESISGNVSGMAQVSHIVKASSFTPTVNISGMCSMIVDGTPLSSSSNSCSNRCNISSQVVTTSLGTNFGRRLAEGILNSIGNAFSSATPAVTRNPRKRQREDHACDVEVAEPVVKKEKVHIYIPLKVKDEPCEDGADGANSSDATDNTLTTCKFCLSNKIKLCAHPCGHAQYCVACAKKTEKKMECFVCQEKIKRFNKFFM